MDERTRAYLRGRFRDHYRRTEIALPPDADRREWGYIPFSEGSTTMVRHRSLLDLGAIDEFLARKRPRHVYFSAGRYDDPGAGSMREKGWREADLVFDLDADHLPGVDPDEDSYGEMLATCKDALHRLLDFLEDDFGFEDLTVVFSGGRGYHVHVRDESVRELDRDHRREIVDYVRGNGVTLDDLVTREAVAGMGRETPADKRTLDTSGGWSRRVHRRLMDLVEEVRGMEASAARERLQSFEGIGEGSSEKLLDVFEDRCDELRAGNVDVHGRAYRLARLLTERTVEEESAPIDEPVTTDVNRLIRLPGSLHGGSGLAVRRIDRGDLDGFDPLDDAVPETFTGQEIRIEVADGETGEISIGGDTFTVSPGTHNVPEQIGVFLMARDRAEKARE